MPQNYELCFTFKRQHFLKLRCFLSIFASPVDPISTPHSPWPSIYVERWRWIWWSHTLHVSCLEGCLEPPWQRWTCLISVSLKHLSQTLRFVHKAELWLNRCQQAMTSRENFAKAHGAAFALLQSDSEIGGALFGEVAMTCLVTMVVLLGAVNPKTRSPLVPFLVGCTVIINILAGWEEKKEEKNREENNCESTEEKFISTAKFWISCTCLFYQRRCIWHLSEPSQSLRSSHSEQLLDLPLDLLGGAHRRRPNSSCTGSVRATQHIHFIL